MPNVAASAGPQQRMLAAILPAGTQVWHFKLQGPADGVGGQKDQFETFLKSVSFTSAGQPQWTVPAGWKQLPGEGMRFATFQVLPDVNPQLELTVTPLGPESAALGPNVNRWRGQVGLSPISE